MPRLVVCLAAVAGLATGCHERNRKSSVASKAPVAAARSSHAAVAKHQAPAI